MSVQVRPAPCNWILRVASAQSHVLWPAPQIGSIELRRIEIAKDGGWQVGKVLKTHGAVHRVVDAELDG